MATLDKYTSVGCYPIFYVDGSSCLCAACADENEANETFFVDINWEDHELFCDECGERIESAYAEDEAVS
jgi:hypothetical protein